MGISLNSKSFELSLLRGKGSRSFAKIAELFIFRRQRVKVLSCRKGIAKKITRKGEQKMEPNPVVIKIKHIKHRYFYKKGLYQCGESNEGTVVIPL